MGVPVPIESFRGGIAASAKRGLAGSYRYGRHVDIHNEDDVLKLLPKTVKDSGSTVTELLIDSCRVPNGDTYFIGEDKGFYKRTAAGVWSKIGTISGDTNGMGIHYWPSKDTIYITTDTSLSTYGRISSSPVLTHNKYTNFIDQQIDVAGNADYPDQSSIQGWWKMEAAGASDKPVVTLVDLFNDNSFDTALWTSAVGGDGTVTEAGSSYLQMFAGGTGADIDRAQATQDTAGGNGIRCEFSFTLGVNNNHVRLGVSDTTTFTTTAWSAPWNGDFIRITVVETGIASVEVNGYTVESSNTLQLTEDAHSTHHTLHIYEGVDGKTHVQIDSTEVALITELIQADNFMRFVAGAAGAVDRNATLRVYDSYNYTTTFAPNLSDSSVNGNTLTNNNTVGSETADTQQGTGSADFESDDNDYLSIADASQTGLDITSDLAITCHVKLESAPTSGNRMGLVTKWITSGDARAYHLSYFNDSGTLKLEFGLSTDGTSANADTALVTQTLTVGTWFHIGVVYDASVPDVTFYVNGSAHASGAQAITGGSIANTGAEFAIGRLDGGSYLDGLVDEVMIWNTELSAVDVNNAQDAPAGSYALGTSIVEDSDNTFSFTPDHDPHVSVVLPVAATGTGDWTVTLHDDANNAIATKTIANASLTAAADNTFTFANQVRLFPGFTYHYHVTSTVADGTMTPGSDVIDTKADRLVKPKSKAHPITEFNDFIAIANGNYLTTFDGLPDVATDADGTNTVAWDQRAITLPSGYEIQCVGRFDEFIVAGAEYRGDNQDDFSKGLLLFWDGTTEDFPNFFFEVEEGGVQWVLPVKNRLMFGAGLQGEVFVTDGEDYIKIKKLPRIGRGEYVRSFFSSVDVHEGMPLMGYAYATDSATFAQGVYAYGAKEVAYDDVLTHDHTPSTGSVEKTTLRIGLVKSYGTDLFLSWDDNGTYGCDIVEPGNDPYASGYVEMLIFDDTRPYKKKKFLGVKAMHTALPAGGTVQLSRKSDRASSWTNGTANEADDTTQTVYDFDTLAYEFEAKLTLGATTESPEVTCLVYDIDRQESSKAILKNA